MPEPEKHDVRIDRVGPMARPRWTCYTDGATIVCQPSMDTASLADAVRRFVVDHPPKEPIKDEGWRG